MLLQLELPLKGRGVLGRVLGRRVLTLARPDPVGRVQHGVVVPDAVTALVRGVVRAVRVTLVARHETLHVSAVSGLARDGHVVSGV